MRTRSYDVGTTGTGFNKTYNNSGAVTAQYIETTTRPLVTNSCVDDIGRSTVHPLTISKIERKFEPLDSNGKYAINSSFQGEYNKLPPNQYVRFIDNVHGSHTLDSVSTATSKLLSRTNPGRADISLPEAIGELKDLPDMLKEGMFLFSKSHPRPKITSSSPGSAYLQWTFGWWPFLLDLGSLLTVQQQIDSRVKELTAMYENGGIRRRLKLGTSMSVGTDNPVQVASGAGATILMQNKHFTKGEQWGTVRWVPTAIPKSLSPPSNYKLAHDAVLGISGNHLGDIWNLLPWSWMADWFSNIGSFLETHSNRIPVEPRNICIMRTLTTTNQWERTDTFTKVKGGKGTVTYVTKERFIGSDTLSAHIPFLTGGQLSILGALLSSRSRAGRW